MTDKYDVLCNRISRCSMSFLPKLPAKGAVVTGEFLNSASEDLLLSIIMNYSELVFARTTPI